MEPVSIETKRVAVPPSQGLNLLVDMHRCPQGLFIMSEVDQCQQHQWDQVGQQRREVRAPQERGTPRSAALTSRGAL